MPLAESAEMPSQRLFFALWPDAATREAMSQVQRELAVAGGRPLHPLDLHITLAFLGQVSPDQLPCVLAAAEQVHAAAHTLTLTRQGWWRGPRVAWCAPEETPPAMLELVDQLWNGLAGCGFEREARPFKAHVTLLRKARSIETAPLASPIQWELKDFALVASLSGPGAPRYKVLQRWPLHGDVLQG